MANITVSNLLPERLTNSDLNNSTFVGIDFGTSTTVISIAEYDQNSKKMNSYSIKIEQELSNGIKHSSEKIPTVIAYLKPIGKNKIIVGQGAADLKHAHSFKIGKNIWYSFKTAIGQDKGALYYDCEIENENLKIRNPNDAVSLFFRFLKSKIEDFVVKNNLPSNIKYAISIPASFEANQRRELITALASNGIQLAKQSLIDEPNAAFLSYIEQSFIEGNPLKVPDHRNVNTLVFDFGAGTCDVSILEIGNGVKGLYSKNLSISKYYEIGGDDIDRFIALDILLPQFVNQCNLKMSDLRKGEIKKDILPLLLKTAEQLKIMICEKVDLQFSSKLLPTLALSNDKVEVGYEIEIEVPRLGKFIYTNPSLRFAEFQNVMKIFCNQKQIKPHSIFDFVKPFESIFNPVKTALNKAKLQNEDIDYVLFIGGSSKNPYIRNAINQYFPDSEIIVPSDLQTHVSKGAAIHSLIFNGFGKNLIQPITSEPVLVLTKQGLVTLISAGTEVPSEINRIDDLIISEDGLDLVELPIFLGSIDKMLFNFKVYRPHSKKFKKGEIVKIAAEINSDKILSLRCYIDESEIICEPLSPFSNSEMTTNERVVAIAEKNFNIQAERNNGIPTKEGYENLYKAYRDNGFKLLAAQTLEELNDKYPSSNMLNEIGVLYSGAGDKLKALEYYEKAHSANPGNSTIAFNLALQYKHEDNEKFENMVEKVLEMEPDDPEALLEKGRILNKKAKNSGNELIEKAFNKYKVKFDSNRLQEWEYSWFASTADELGKFDMAMLIRESQPKQKTNGLWNDKNLTSKGNFIEQLKIGNNGLDD
jgi:molecular chaperone DnaK